MARSTRFTVRAGDLNNVITIQQQAQTSTGRANEAVVTWSTFRTVYAEVVALSGMELTQSSRRLGATQGQIYAKAVKRFRCRHGDTDGVETNMRVSFEGKLYDIRAVVPDHRHSAMIILETELVE